MPDKLIPLDVQTIAGVTYRLAYLPVEGTYLCVRETTTATGYSYDYAPMADGAAFAAATASPDTQTYLHISGLQLDLSWLFNHPSSAGAATTTTGGLTDTQLRASALALPTGASTSAAQTTAQTSLTATTTALGTIADSTATSDAGSFSLMAFTKRAMSNWSTLFTRLPLIGAQLGTASLSVVPNTTVAFPVTVKNTFGNGNDATITTGGTAQSLLLAINGYAVYNPDATNELWISDTTTAALNGLGSIKITAGGGYESPFGYKPVSAVSVFGAVTGQKITAKSW